MLIQYCGVFKAPRDIVFVQDRVRPRNVDLTWLYCGLLDQFIDSLVMSLDVNIRNTARLRSIKASYNLPLIAVKPLDMIYQKWGKSPCK